MHSIGITSEEFNKFIYFALSKFEHDPLHTQGTSSKSDYIGGFIDRWINRISEELIFNKLLLADRTYKAGIDYFLYDNQSMKNAPDILGLEDENNIIPFAKYDNDCWVPVTNRPWIEIKTFREKQKMLSVRDSQMIDDHYYVMCELHIKPNYLKNVFNSSLFSDEIKNSMVMREGYIERDVHQHLQSIQEVQFNNDIIGQVNLLGVFKGSDLVSHCNFLAAGQPVKYITNIERVASIPRPNIHELMSVNSLNLYIRENYLNIRVENPHNIIIKKKNVGSMYIKVLNECKINGKELTEGNYKISFSKFQRSSTWAEYVAHKYTFDQSNDQTTELLNSLDTIYQNNIHNI
ncbi:hypothetical protein JGU65_24800 [Bacillus sp. T_4]|nr:hypothetical protein [Bacillus sp. T_4]